MSGYIGASPVPQATQHREAFTATAAQTSFPTVGYTPQFVDVYLNGIKLAAEDYTATNGSDIVLTTGAALDDILEYVAYTPFEVASQTFTGTTTVDALVATSVSAGSLVAGTATYGGTADVITITTGLSLAALTTGMEIRFRATAANTGATTINVDAIGAVAALTVTDAALPADYIRTDVDTVIRYNGTNWIASRQVEHGSNANGDYSRWENGVQICTRVNTYTLVMSRGVGYTIDGGAILTSATFVGTPARSLQGYAYRAGQTTFHFLTLSPRAYFSTSSSANASEFLGIGFGGRCEDFGNSNTATAQVINFSATGFWY